MTDDSSSLRQRAIGWANQLPSIAIALGVVLAVRTVVAEPYHVPSSSMVPTLLVGDQLIASKFAYGWGKYSSPIGLMPDFSGRLFGHAPERGDVIVFRLPRDPDTTYVKRLIGLPGDRIQMREGRLYINDAMVARRAIGTFDGDRRYVETLPSGREHEIIEISDTDRYDDTPVFVVPARHYFMMGDNRDNSLDSRVPSACRAATSAANACEKPATSGALSMAASSAEAGRKTPGRASSASARGTGLPGSR